MAAFLTDRDEAGLTFGTLDGYCSGIAHRHHQEGLPDPTADFVVRRVRRGLRRIMGVAPRRQAHPPTVTEIAQILKRIDTRTSREVALPDELATHPVVVNARSEDDGVPWVTPAHEAAGWDAAGALLSAGHARIAFINSAEGGLTPQLRERGFRERAAAGGLRQSDCSVVAAPASAAGAREVALHLLRQPAPPTGIFCFNDRMAMGVYRAAAELGIAVPSGLSIIGSDEDQHIAEGLYPSLTTIALPARAMATWAVDHLYARINNPALPAATAALRCPLVLRESVSAPGRAAADQSS